MIDRQGNLFDSPAMAYPLAPGFKERTTSRDAAYAIAGRASILRRRVYTELLAAGAAGLTADQVAARLGESVLSVRPRVTELAKAKPQPWIVPTGERRKNESGLKAKVWRAV